MKKALLITGATSGVGLSLVLHLRSRYDIVAMGRSAERLAELFDDEPRVICYQADLSSEEETSEALAEIQRDHDVGFIINNAGVMLKGSIAEVGSEELRRSYEVNALAPMTIMKSFLPGMAGANFGRIVNVTSGAPLNCHAGFAAYSGSKAALNAFTVTAAREYEGYDIKINLMSPGPVRTAMAPWAEMDPSACHSTADYLLGLDRDGPTGRFFWLGYEVPLFPDLAGVKWGEGVAGAGFRRVVPLKVEGGGSMEGCSG
jgi:short-subunit dehydrogenase